MRRVVISVVLVATILSGASGCVTLSKFHGLMERVDVLEKEKEQILDRLDRDEARMENLNSRVQEAQDEQRKAGASRGATLDDLQQVIAQTSGKIEEVNFHAEARRQQLQSIMDFLDERFGVSFTGDAAALPKDKDGLFKLGNDRLTQGMPRKARSILRLYKERYPKDERADDAQYLIAESYVQEKKFDLAVREFQVVHDQFSKSELVPKALWRIADSLVEQKQCKKAIAVLKYLRETQRKTPEAEKVPARLKELKGTCK